MAEKSYDLDLDALAPVKKLIKFGNKDITVEPPTTLQLVRIMKASQKLQSAMDLNKPDEEIAVAMDGLAVPVKEIIPELKDVELSTGQINGLAEMIISSAMPAQLKELKARGITVASTKNTPPV